jgi:hypothetical protein
MFRKQLLGAINGKELAVEQREQMFEMMSASKIHMGHCIVKILHILASTYIYLYAVCMDGTPPAYNLDPGSGAGSRSWIVNLEVSLI